jgi:hypothetical protein
VCVRDGDSELSRCNVIGTGTVTGQTHFLLKMEREVKTEDELKELLCDYIQAFDPDYVDEDKFIEWFGGWGLRADNVRDLLLTSPLNKLVSWKTTLEPQVHLQTKEVQEKIQKIGKAILLLS